MEELTEEDDSDETSTTEDEQIPTKEEESEDSSDNNETYVIESDEDETDADTDLTEEPEEEVTDDPAADVEEPEEEVAEPVTVIEEIEKDSDEEEVVKDGVSPDNMEIAEDVTISVYQPVYSEDGKKIESYKPLEDAEVTFTNNSVDSENRVNSKVKNITFKVTTKEGLKLSALEFARATTAEGLDNPTSKKSISAKPNDPNAEYSISAQVSELISKKEMVRLFVTTKPVQYTFTAVTTNKPANTSVYLPNKSGEFDLKTVASSLGKVEYGSSLSFAIAGDDMATAEVYAQKEGGEKLPLTGSESSVEVDGDDMPYLAFSLDPTAVDKIFTTRDDTVTVTIGTKTSYTVTLKAADYKHENVTVTDYTPEDAEEGEEYVALPAESVGGSYTAAQKIGFTATAATNYKLTEAPRVWWTPENKPKQETELSVEGEMNANGTEGSYVVDLSAITENNAQLHVEIKADMDDTLDNVKTIAFEGDGHVKVFATATPEDEEKENLIGKTQKDAADDKYDFYVQADDGYEVAKVEVTVAKTYTDDNSSDEETFAINDEGGRLEENSEVYPFSHRKLMSVSYRGADPADAAAEKEERAWDTRNIKVSITTQLQKAVLDRNVTFVSWGNYETGAERPTGAYKFTVKEEEGKVEKLSDDEYAVKKDTEYVELTVNTDIEPDIIVHGNKNIAEKVDGEGEGITYRIPAISLDENDTVVIQRKAKDVKVYYNNADSLSVTVEDTDANKGGLATAKGTDHDKTDFNYDEYIPAKVNAGAMVKITGTLTNGKKAPITAVTYQVGEGSEQTAEVKNGAFSIETKATDNINVFVTKSTDRTLKLTFDKADGEEIKPVAPNTYVVKEYLKKITAAVYNGEEALDIYSTVVKIGTENAATQAKLIEKNKAAEITVNENERNTDLEVTLVLLESREKVTFTLRTEAPVKTVTYGSEINESRTLSMPVDTQVVTAVSTTDDAPMENLRAAVVGAGDAKISKTADEETLSEKNEVKAVIKDGNLVITALPTADGKAKQPVKVVLYNVNDSERTIIENSDIAVTTKNATVIGKAPEAVEPGASTAKSVQVLITPPAAYSEAAPDGVRDDLVVGDLYYMITMAKPSTSGMSKALSDGITARVNAINTYKYWNKKAVDANGGVTLQVIPDDVDVNGKVVECNVTVALVQGIADVDYSEEPLSEEALIKKPVAGGNKAVKVSTKEVKYETTDKSKLSLKKGTTQIITGNEAWTTVATPQFNAGVDHNDVKVEFVDTKSGREQGKSFWGLETKYDALANAVMVRFNQSELDKYGYKYNIDDSKYQNLGVKVSANTESTGYGIYDVVKLTVKNGIEKIDVSAQPYVRYTGNKVTFKTAVELNQTSIDKKYAPLKKTVTYEIIPDPASKNSAVKPNVNVIVKNGTVTVQKGYAAGKEDVDNRFTVKVKAADYAGNTTEGESDPITITSESRFTAKVQIVKPDENYGWEKATIVNSNQLIVTDNEDAEYRAVVLSSDVPAGRKTYDVTPGSSDIVPATALTFAPAKGGVRIEPITGDICVTKLGKATISATDKTDKKNKDSIKVEFVQTSEQMGLEFTQLDSVWNVDGESFYASKEFSGNNTTYFAVNVVNGKTKDTISLSDAKLKPSKTVKNVTPKSDNDWRGNIKGNAQYVIAVTGKTNEITLTSKKQGNTSYTLTNNAFKDVKAPKIALADKKLKVVQKGGVQSVRYIVSEKNQNFEGRYVMLSVDGTKKNPADVNGAFDGENGVRYIDRVIPIREGGVFDIKIDPDYAGSYNLNAVVGDLVEGEFIQAYKEAKLAVKVAKQGSVNLKVTGSYTLDVQTAAKVNIQYSGGRAWFANEAYEEDRTTHNWKVVDKNYAMNAITKDGVENEFTKYFEARIDENGNLGTIGLKEGLDPAVVSQLASGSLAKDMVGFISVDSYGKRMDVKITIKFKASKLTAKADSVFGGDDMTLDVKVYNGKAVVPVRDFTIEGDAAGFKKDNNSITNEGTIRLKGDKNVTLGDKKLTLSVTPKYAAVYKGTQKVTPVTVEVKFKVLDAATTKNKVVLAKGAKWVVDNSDYAGPTGGKDDVKTKGVWKEDIPYTFKNRLSIKETTDITVTMAEKDLKNYPFVSFTSDKYNAALEHQTLTAVIDRNMYEEMAAVNKKLAGKTITVNFEFTYGGKISGADYYPVMGKDAAKLKITLPKKTEKENVTDKDFKDIENSIQNMVNTMSAYYQDEYESEEVKTRAQYNEELRSKVEERILKAAGGAPVYVKVDYEAGEKGRKDKDPTKSEKWATAYTAEVRTSEAAKDKIYSGKFEVKSDSVANDVARQISDLGAENWKKVKTATKTENGKEVADEAMQSLFTLTKDTTEAQYATMIRNILKQDGTATANIGIAVETVEKGKKDPTTTEKGWYNVKVTVTDRNVARSENTEYSERVHSYPAYVDYEFDELADAAKVKTALNTALGANGETLQKILADAWAAAVAAGVTSTDAVEFDNEIIKQIEEEAKALLAKDLEVGVNSYTSNNDITVTGVESGTFNKTISNNKLSAMSYTLNLSDATTGEAKNVAVKIAISGPDITVKALQQPSDLKTEADKQFEDGRTAIKTVMSDTAACEAIKAAILKLSENPAYDTTGLKVEAIRFVAPAGKTNGLVSVDVTFAEGQTSTYENIVILAKGDDFEGSDDDAKNLNKVKGMIEARLSSAELEKLILSMYEEYAKDTTQNAAKKVTNDNVVTEIKEILQGKDGKGGLLKGTGYQLISSDAVGVDGDGFKVPELKASTGVKLPGLTVKIQKGNDETTQEEITIKGGTAILKNNAKFQSLSQAMTEIKKKLKPTTTIENIGLKLKTETVEESVKYTGIEAGSEELAKLVQTWAEACVTNPLLEISNEADETESKDKTLYKMKNGAVVIESWMVTVTDKSNAEANDGKEVHHFIINEKKAENSTAVKEVTIGHAEDPSTNLTIEDGKDGKEGNPAEAAISDDASEVTIKATATPIKPEGEVGEDFTWKVVSADDKAEPIEGITIDESGEEATLRVADTVSGEATVKVTATSTQDKDVYGNLAEGTFYIKLTMTPYVTSFTITGPEEIELDEDGNGDSENGVKYEAKLEGKFLAADDVKKIEWSTTEGLTKGDLTGVTSTDNKDGLVKLVFATAKDLLDTPQQKVCANLPGGFQHASGADKAELSVTIKSTVAAEDADKINIELAETAGMSKGTLTLTEGDGEDATTKEIPKITVTGEEVRIPLSVSSENDTRQWEYEVAQSEDAGNSVASNLIGEGNGIEIETSGTRSWLVIKENVPEIQDAYEPEKDENGELVEGSPAAREAKKIRLTAKSKAKGSLAVKKAESLEVALTVVKTVEEAKIYKWSAESDGTKDGGIGAIEAKAEDTLYLQTELEGFHIPADEKAGKQNVSYRITSRRGTNLETAKVEGTDTEGMMKLVIPAESSGTMIVAATYKDANDTTKPAVIASRVINVKGTESKVAEITVTDADGTAIDNSIIEIDKADAKPVVTTFEVENLAAEVKNTLGWKYSATGSLSEYVTMDSGKLSIIADPALPAGSYSVTVTASWVEGNVPHRASKIMTVKVKKVVESIAVTAGKASTEPDWSKVTLTGDVKNGYTLTIPNDVEAKGTIILKAALNGKRFIVNDSDAGKVKCETAEPNKTEVTATLAENGSGEITITLPEGKTIGAGQNVVVTLSVNSEGDTNMVAKSEATTKVTISVPAKE